MMSPEVAALTAAQQQVAPTGPIDPQQLQQMSAMMAMAAAGAAGNAAGGAAAMPLHGTAPCAGGMGALAGMPLAPPAQMAPGAADGAAVPGLGMGGMDPATLAYAQVFAQYLQQAQAYASCGMDPTAGLAAATAVGAVPFPTAGAPSPALPPTASPTINVAVEGMRFQYQLTQDDLHKVFSRYGIVGHIAVDEAGTTAQITFQEYASAQAAMTDLNGKVLNGLDGTLRITWSSQGALAGPAPPPPYPVMSPFGGGWGGAPAPGAGASWPLVGSAPGGGDAVAVAAQAAAALAAGGCHGTAPGAGLGALGVGGAGGMDGRAPAHVKGVRKYTCRFLIGIENDKDFQVVRRIIGAKGTNMKRIVRQTEAPGGVAGAKLRLRGVGSGYFEGAGQRESSEPLQLCVSCTSPDGYKTAVRLVEELLTQVYDEYRQFCRENGRPEPDLHPTPQLVSGGGRGGGGGGCGAGGADGAGADDACDGEGDDDDDDAEGADGPGRGGAGGGRRRGRRSRAKKGDAAKAGERGDPPPKAPPIEEIERLIDARNEARRQCNFTEADRIRQSLHERGVALMDEPGARGRGAEVTTWRYWRE